MCGSTLVVKITTSYNNFAKGAADHDLNGRYDLPIYKSSSDVFQNFYSNFKGNAIYRPGFEEIVKFVDCRFIEFKFNKEQSYLCLLYANKIKFLSYDVTGALGFVQSGGSDLEVDTPYTLAEAKKLKVDRNSDVMELTHIHHAPRKLTRVSATSFTLTSYTRTADPFGQSTISAITQANPGQVTANGHGRSTGDVVRVEDVAGMTEVNNLTFTITVVDVNNFTIGVDTTGYTAYTSGGIVAKDGDYPRCVRYYEGRKYFAGTENEPTTLFGSKVSDYDDMTVGTNDDDGLELPIAEIAEPIDWLMNGNNSLIAGSNEAIVAVNGGGVDTPITPTTATAKVTNTSGSATTQPIRKDEFMFYVRNDGRALNYFNYDILTESFKAEDANVLSYDITLGKIEQLVYKKDRDDLVYSIRGDGALLSLNFNARERIIAWHEHFAGDDEFIQIERINNNEGDVQLFALIKHGSDYFICRKAEVVEFPLFHTFYTGDKDADEDAAIRLYAEKLKDCIYSDISTVFKDLHTSTITYAGALAVDSLGTITSTAGDFASGDVGRRIVYKTVTGVEYGIFEITGYTSATVVSVKVLYPPTALSYSSWYKSFLIITGLTDFIGETMSVVADGGYFDDYVVDVSGQITLDRETTVATNGFKYTGIIKTFIVGMPVQAINLQTTLKRLYRAGVRFVASAGGEIGTDLYNMTPIQKFDTSGLFDNPPNPLDDTHYVDGIEDTYDKEKSIYIRQDQPLPLNVTAVLCDIKFSTKN